MSVTHLIFKTYVDNIGGYYARCALFFTSANGYHIFLSIGLFVYQQLGGSFPGSTDGL